MLESFVQNIEENMNDLEKRAGANIGEVTLENRDLEQYALGLVSRVATEQEKVKVAEEEVTEELGHREDAMERKLEDSLRPARTLIVDAEDEARRNRAKLVEYVGDMQAGLVRQKGKVRNVESEGDTEFRRLSGIMDSAKRLDEQTLQAGEALLDPVFAKLEALLDP